MSRNPSSCYTSIKTRIETTSARFFPWRRDSSCYTSIKTRIETAMGRLGYVRTLPSCYTSIKTRIETPASSASKSTMGEPLATLPSKQGLKRSDTVLLRKPLDHPLATLPSKQGLKRLVWIPALLRVWPLATLPSKQGLKPGWTNRCSRRIMDLLLHFHQNKD